MVHAGCGGRGDCGYVGKLESYYPKVDAEKKKELEAARALLKAEANGKNAA
jgi:hypothetical protein